MTTYQPTEPGATTCRRCGTCCRKGGPALHLEDETLVSTGRIPLRDLFTIRRGEPAYDNVAGRIAPTQSDIIKIKSGPDHAAACRYFQAGNNTCAIYAHRPLECRVLACRQPEALQAVYDRNRLTRSHLLARISGLWDLVSDHQDQCDYRPIEALAKTIRHDPGSTDAADQLMILIGYDYHIRQGVLERSTLTEDILEFLFGRPLSFTISMFQLRLVQHDTEFTVRPVA